MFRLPTPTVQSFIQQSNYIGKLLFIVFGDATGCMKSFLSQYLYSLSEKSLTEAARRLMNADLHGAILRVTKSKCPSFVGATGILLQETRNSFVLVTVNNRLKSKYLVISSTDDLRLGDLLLPS